MDPETTDAFLVLGKLALLIGGGCVVTMATLWALVAGFLHYIQRKERVDELMPLYKAGTIGRKPTILNVYRLPGHGT
jgi:hypothetical protein